MIEKMDSSTSACARGSNPTSVSSTEDVELILQGSFKAAAAAAGGKLQVWYSNLTSGSEINENPPDSQLFQKLAPVDVGSDGHVVLKNVAPEEIYTVGETVFVFVCLYCVNMFVQNFVL